MGRCGGCLTFVEMQQLRHWYGWGSFQQQQQNIPKGTPSAGFQRSLHPAPRSHRGGCEPAGGARHGAAVPGPAQSTSHDDKFFPSDDCAACGVPCPRPAQAGTADRAGPTPAPSSSPTTPGPAPRLGFQVQDAWSYGRWRGTSSSRSHGEKGTRTRAHRGPLACHVLGICAPGGSWWPPPDLTGTTYSGDDSGVRLDISSGVGTADKDRERSYGDCSALFPQGPLHCGRHPVEPPPDTVKALRAQASPAPSCLDLRQPRPFLSLGCGELSQPLVLKSGPAFSGLQPALLSPNR